MTSDIQKMTSLLEAHAVEHPEPVAGCAVCTAHALRNAYAHVVEQLCEAQRVQNDVQARRWGWIEEQLNPLCHQQGFVVARDGLWLSAYHRTDSSWDEMAEALKALNVRLY